MMDTKRLKQSFQYAYYGMLKIYKEEHNLRLQLKIAIMVIVVAFFIRVSRVEFAILIIVIALVLFAEMMNSVVEKVVDILKPRLDSGVKEIKDTMAGVVLFVSILAVVVGILIFSHGLFD